MGDGGARRRVDGNGNEKGEGMTQITKEHVLKQYEVYGYRIAYYLLGNESLATAAATRALAELYRMDEFFRLPDAYQRQTMKRIFMKHSLSARAAARLQPS
jgi:hypothetical protein